MCNNLRISANWWMLLIQGSYHCTRSILMPRTSTRWSRITRSFKMSSINLRLQRSGFFFSLSLCFLYIYDLFEMFIGSRNSSFLLCFLFFLFPSPILAFSSVVNVMELGFWYYFFVLVIWNWFVACFMAFFVLDFFFK